MKTTEFEQLMNQTFEQLKKISASKGVEYARGGDQLANFKRGSDMVGVEPESVAIVFSAKHWDSILTFVKTLQTNGGKLNIAEKSLSESIDGRILDMIHYLLLLQGLIKERRQMEDLLAK